jgi:hypothetical protein
VRGASSMRRDFETCRPGFGSPRHCAHAIGAR